MYIYVCTWKKYLMKIIADLKADHLNTRLNRLIK